MMKLNKTDILMVAYVYPGSDREQWQDCTLKIREYLHDKLGGPGIRMSHASDASHSGIVDKIVVGDIAMPFEQVKALAAGIPEACKAEGLTIWLSYKRHDEEAASSWRRTF